MVWRRICLCLMHSHWSWGRYGFPISDLRTISGSHRKWHHAIEGIRTITALMDQARTGVTAMSKETLEDLDALADALRDAIKANASILSVGSTWTGSCSSLICLRCQDGKVRSGNRRVIQRSSWWQHCNSNATGHIVLIWSCCSAIEISLIGTGFLNSGVTQLYVEGPKVKFSSASAS